LKENKLAAKGIYGIFPANQINDDDIELTDEKEENHYKPFDFASAVSKPKVRQILHWLILLLKDNG
jgi:cobalamin-dependent methionine synthase I